MRYFLIDEVFNNVNFGKICIGIYFCFDCLDIYFFFFLILMGLCIFDNGLFCYFFKKLIF